MKKLALIFSIIFISQQYTNVSFASINLSATTPINMMPSSEEHHTTEKGGMHASEESHHGGEPAPWSVIPFIALLLMIATGPLFFAHFWHKYYPAIAISLGFIVVGYYVFALGNAHQPIHSIAEYISFIALLTALFVASGGILIKVDKAGTPAMNVMILIIGAMIANIIGTTGASMLLIRPFIRLNKDRIKPYHIVFFIFIVSNVGGSLTPIGDPPLFLGFLKGVPFFWTMQNIFFDWVVGVGLLALIFFITDKRNYSKTTPTTTDYSGKVEIKGAHSIIWLAITIGAVFIDPNIFSWVPALNIDGTNFSYIREIIMFAAAFMAYKTADKESLKGNEFDFEPIKEVAYIFIGIFATMMPALQLIGVFASSPSGQKMVSIHSLYWATGSLSGVLDNAPTYLNFLAAGMGKFGLDIGDKLQVLEFVNTHTHELAAISVSSVFFGAITYIGNAPNFMVKSIAEQVGIDMPAFMTYVVKYSLPILLPVLFVTWLIFFVLL